MPKIHSSIKNPIAETLLVPLYMRAIHSQKPNPIITDPDAVALLGKLPYQFDDMDNKPKSEIGIALRVRYFDDKARQFLTNHSQGVIINVGCGLDTRLQRLGELANRAYFYNLDIDEVITIRHQWLTPLDNEYSISSSMFEADWLDELIKKHPDTPFLFLIEGVMMYFDEDSNRAFMTMLANALTLMCILMHQANLSVAKPNITTPSKTQERYSNLGWMTQNPFNVGIKNCIIKNIPILAICLRLFVWVR